jgi:hypothetical protein
MEAENWTQFLVLKAIWPLNSICKENTTVRKLIFLPWVLFCLLCMPVTLHSTLLFPKISSTFLLQVKTSKCSGKNIPNTNQKTKNFSLQISKIYLKRLHCLIQILDWRWIRSRTTCGSLKNAMLHQLTWTTSSSLGLTIWTLAYQRSVWPKQISNRSRKLTNQRQAIGMLFVKILILILT